MKARGYGLEERLDVGPFRGDDHQLTHLGVPPLEGTDGLGGRVGRRLQWRTEGTERGLDVPADPEVDRLRVQDIFADRPQPTGTAGSRTVVTSAGHDG